MAETTRFAPSPTGFLHLGHAYSAITAWQRARATGGKFLLRVEDIDAGRCRPEYREAILEDLIWLGLEWDGAVRVQSECLPDYRASLDRLTALGLLYPCFCTRSDIQREISESGSASHMPDGSPRYPGTCRHMERSKRIEMIASSVPYALRLDLSAALARTCGPLFFMDDLRGEVHCDLPRFGDVVLARKDTPTSYHLCVTHDDALQGVTLVTRGEDLLWSTPIHRLLQALLDLPVPRYAHHRLITDDTGRRLAKRDKAATLRELRASGISARDVWAMVGIAA